MYSCTGLETVGHHPSDSLGCTDIECIDVVPLNENVWSSCSDSNGSSQSCKKGRTWYSQTSLKWPPLDRISGWLRVSSSEWANYLYRGPARKLLASHKPNLGLNFVAKVEPYRKPNILTLQEPHTQVTRIKKSFEDVVMFVLHSC